MSDTMKEAAPSKAALIADIKDAIKALSDGVCYPELLEAIDRLASLSPAAEGKSPVLILLSTGEYSDYSVQGAFRPLRDFTMGEAANAFRAQFKPEHDWSQPDPYAFAAWLVTAGYIEDTPTNEVHIGSYGQIELSKEAAAEPILATPAPVPASTVSTPVDALLREVGRQMVEMTTTVRSEDEWLAIPQLWQQCMEERDKLRAAAALRSEQEAQPAIPKVVLHLPDGDTRTPLVRFVQWEDGALHVCINVRAAQPTAQEPITERAEPQGLTKAQATAPDHIWLDLGDDTEAWDMEFRELHEVTWSEDNATGNGIRYVRADRATAGSKP